MLHGSAAQELVGNADAQVHWIRTHTVDKLPLGLVSTAGSERHPQLTAPCFLANAVLSPWFPAYSPACEVTHSSSLLGKKSMVPKESVLS